MATPASTEERSSYGQEQPLTVVDRFGVWLGGRRIRRSVGDFAGKRIGDFGCGYNASFARSVLDVAEHVVLIDVTIADDLKENAKVTAIEGMLPDALEELDSLSLDLVILSSVLEHLWEPERALAESRRLTRPGGVVLVNVPSWRGKRWLELSAFRFGMSPADGVDDHKRYYDPRDLWPLLVQAGFKPSEIRCFRHKFGLNTWAECRRSDR
jgi:SAM-dependent methyltransferase